MDIVILVLLILYLNQHNLIIKINMIKSMYIILTMRKSVYIILLMRKSVDIILPMEILCGHYYSIGDL